MDTPITDNRRHHGNGGGAKKWFSGSLLFLWASHLCFYWSDTLWQFGLGLYLVYLEEGVLRLVAMFGFLTAGSVFLFGGIIGHWVDRNNRLKAVTIAVLVHGVSSIVMSLVLVLVLTFEAEVMSLWDGWLWTLLSTVIIILAVAAFLFGMGYKIAMERDWFVVLAAGNTTRLAKINSVTRSLDLACQTVAPLVAGQLMSFMSLRVAAIVMCGNSLLTMVALCVMLRRLYRLEPRLAVKAGNWGSSQVAPVEESITSLTSSADRLSLNHDDYKLASLPQLEVVSKPEALPEPAVVPKPEIGYEPEALLEPELGPKPEAVHKPEVVAKPEDVLKPEVVSEPEAGYDGNARQAMSDTIDTCDNTPSVLLNSNDVHANAVPDETIAQSDHSAEPELLSTGDMTCDREHVTPAAHGPPEPNPPAGQATLQGGYEAIYIGQSDEDIHKESLLVSGAISSGSSEETCLKLFLGNFIILFKGWKIYAKQSVVLAALGLAFLYMTVLTMHSLTMGYVYANGVSEYILGILASIGGLFGFVGTLIFPKCRQLFGLERTGMLGLGWQITWLALPLMSIWLPGSRFDPSFLFATTDASPVANCSQWQNVTSGRDFVTYSASPSDGNVTVFANHRSIRSILQIGFPQELLEFRPESFRHHDGDHTHAISKRGVDETSQTGCGETEATTGATVSVVVFLIGLMASRIGLWIADLTVVQIIQEHVVESERGIVNGVQNSMCMIFSTLKSLLVIFFPHVETFGIVVILSFCFVLTGDVLFFTYCWRHTDGRAFRVNCGGKKQTTPSRDGGTSKRATSPAAVAPCEIIVGSDTDKLKRRTSLEDDKMDMKEV